MDFLRKIFGGGGGGGGSRERVYWVYARCRRCGEPLRSRIDLANELSLADDGESYIVRKGLVGGERRCYQRCEVTLTFDGERSTVISREITGGEFISEEEYEHLRQNPPVEDASADASTDADEEESGAGEGKNLES